MIHRRVRGERRDDYRLEQDHGNRAPTRKHVVVNNLNENVPPCVILQLPAARDCHCERRAVYFVGRAFRPSVIPAVGGNPDWTPDRSPG